MNILLVSEYFPPDQVGASRRTKVLAEILSNRHRVTVLTSSPHYPKSNSQIKWYKPVNSKNIDNYKVIQFWMPELKMETTIGRIVNYCLFSFIAGFMSLFIRKQDIVWGTSPNIFVTIPINVHHLIHKSKRIINVDDLWPTAPIELGFLKNQLIKLIAIKFAIISLSETDGISTISDKLESIMKKLKFINNPIRTVYVGIEYKRLEKFNNFQVKKIKPYFRFMYSGKLGPAYDFELLIRSFKSWINNTEANAELIIRGTGPLEIEIRKLINKSSCQNIKFDNEYLSDVEYDHLLLSTDTFVLPMKKNFVSSTAIPTKLLEFIASGKPTILIAEGEPRRILQESKGGLVCNYNPHEIIKAFSIFYEGAKINDPEFQFRYIKNKFTNKNISFQANRLIKEISE